MDRRGGQRRHWAEAFKREIVAAAARPGASVSVVARQYDVNANQIARWRQSFSEVAGSEAAETKTGERLPSPSSMPASPPPGLVPVMVIPTPGSTPEDAGGTELAAAASDTIEIEVSGDVRIRVGPGFDDDTLKRVLDVLRHVAGGRETIR